MAALDCLGCPKLPLAALGCTKLPKYLDGLLLDSLLHDGGLGEKWKNQYLATWTQIYKTFYGRNLRMSL